MRAIFFLLKVHTWRSKMYEVRSKKFADFRTLAGRFGAKASKKHSRENRKT